MAGRIGAARGPLLKRPVSPGACLPAMVVLDTNVLSALMRDPPDNVVVHWLDGQTPECVWTTSITVFEVRFGLARMPSGRRRAGALAAASTAG